MDAAAVLLSTKGTLWAGLLYQGWCSPVSVFGRRTGKNCPNPWRRPSCFIPTTTSATSPFGLHISGIVGAKVFAILEDIPNFLAESASTFFSGSGLAIYGGLIGGFLGVYWYLHKHKIPFWPVADAVAPALMIAYGIGRLGCHFSGDGDWGIAAAAQPGWWFFPDWLWSFDYPNNVAQDGVPLRRLRFQILQAPRAAGLPHGAL